MPADLMPGCRRVASAALTKLLVLHHQHFPSMSPRLRKKGIALTAECSKSVVYLRLLYVRAHLSQLQASCTPVPLAPPHARCQTPACAFLQMMAS